MTTSSANTPVITEVRKTGQDYAVDYNDGATTFFTPYNRSPREEMIIALLEAHIAASSRIQSLEATLKPIIDCYGVGSTPEQFVKHVHDFIMEARQALGVSHE
jgi:hypothetical protein